jgi:signal transduction histidine kinase/CheY-like chemotaxis protein
VPHVGPNGDVLGFFALIQDITERKKAAEQLREAKEGLERRVTERTTELTALNTRLQVEVEERRQAQAALQVAKAEAEQANMSKTKFIAAASHDLLQPLNAARMFATALGESRLAPRNRGFARNVITALNAVDELLCALLDISKLDAGVHATEIADFRIERLLTALCDEFGPQARARNLALRLVQCGVVVRTDAVLVGRILRNFLSNAMRYSPSGKILLGCRRRAGGLEVQVWDTGIGIPGDKLGEVFGEFRRLAVDSHDRDRGMGLGLAIVDRIARRLGHEITLRSALGRGSMFGVVLPFGCAQRIRPQAAPFALSGRLDRVAGACVVVVENDEAARDGLSALLRSWHCTVLAADSAAAAVRTLQAQSREPDALIADYHLDGGEIGVAALAMIRDCCARPIPGIIATADRSDAVRDAVRDAGLHLLNKPLKPARLRSLLAHVVASSVVTHGDGAPLGRWTGDAAVGAPAPIDTP